MFSGLTWLTFVHITTVISVEEKNACKRTIWRTNCCPQSICALMCLLYINGAQNTCVGSFAVIMGRISSRCVGGTALGFYMVTHVCTVKFCSKERTFGVRANDEQIHEQQKDLEAGGCWLSPWKLQKEEKQPESSGSIHVKSRYLNRLWTDRFEMKPCEIKPIVADIGRRQGAPWTSRWVITGLTFRDNQTLTFSPMGNLNVPLNPVHQTFLCLEKKKVWTKS